MKKIKLLLLILVCFVWVNAQEKTPSLIINGQLSHYIGKGEKIPDIHGPYRFPVDPGFELLYAIKIKPGLSIMPGICYSWGKLSSENPNSGVQYRTNFKELSFPVLIKKQVGDILFISTGVYFGKYIKADLEFFSQRNETETGWADVPSLSEAFTDEKFILDLYMDIGYSHKLYKTHKIFISPFLKYKMNDYWVSLIRSKVHYGVKLGINLNLKTQEK
jgi:hypothetical protein